MATARGHTVHSPAECTRFSRVNERCDLFNLVLTDTDKNKRELNHDDRKICGRNWQELKIETSRGHLEGIEDKVEL